MNLANTMQKFQDWFTQQWVIFRGIKIDPQQYSWLIGPFGNINGTGEEFIMRLAEKEGLLIERDSKSKGLIQPFDLLNLSINDKSKISPRVIDFYEQTSNYDLVLTVYWNPFFKPLGKLVNRLFSSRINQLNIPQGKQCDENMLKSEIITLTHPITREIKYTVWLRTEIETKRVLYSGIYNTILLPCGKTCVKAIFPLPQGNATVIMTPTVGDNGELILNSSGKKIGDAGFYFLLNDSKGNFWTQFISSFRDKLIIKELGTQLEATQILTLYKYNVLTLKYTINHSI